MNDQELDGAEYAVDRARIEDVVARFAIALDARDVEQAVACFAERVRWDYESLTGRPASEVTPAELAARWRATIVHTDASQHFFSLAHVTVRGDEASCTVHSRVDVRVANAGGAQHSTTHGRYAFGLVRAEGGWRISAVELTVLWNDGNPRIMELAAERGAAG